MNLPNGCIRYAVQDETFVLKCSGEVRLNFSAALNQTIEQVIATGRLRSILIDLSEVTSIDSTTLGLLAKLSNLSRQSFGMLPTLVSTNADISEQLQVMGFAGVFNIVQSATPCPDCLKDLPDQPQDEEHVRNTVLEAHRVLMGLNDSNREEFHDLVSLLEEPQA